MFGFKKNAHTSPNEYSSKMFLYNNRDNTPSLIGGEFLFTSWRRYVGWAFGTIIWLDRKQSSMWTDFQPRISPCRPCRREKRMVPCIIQCDKERVMFSLSSLCKQWSIIPYNIATRNWALWTPLTFVGLPEGSQFLHHYKCKCTKSSEDIIWTSWNKMRQTLCNFKEKVAFGWYL